MAAFGTIPGLPACCCARELEAEGLTGIVADAAFLVALLEEDLRGSERLSVLFHRRQGALRQSAARWFERLGARPASAQGQWLGCCAPSLGPIASASCAAAAAISSVAG